MLAVSKGGSDAYKIGSLIDRLHRALSGTISKVPPCRCADISVMISLRSGPRRVCPTSVETASAYGKFEVKRPGALRHSNDDMAIRSGGYSASNFAGSALMLEPARKSRPPSADWLAERAF